jgi:hypothetical protein
VVSSVNVRYPGAAEHYCVVKCIATNIDCVLGAFLRRTGEIGVERHAWLPLYTSSPIRLIGEWMVGRPEVMNFGGLV